MQSDAPLAKKPRLDDEVNLENDLPSYFQLIQAQNNQNHSNVIEGPNYMCTLCNRQVHCNDISVHLTGKRHLRKVEESLQGESKPPSTINPELIEGRIPPEKQEIPIIHRDDDFIVINKPNDLRIDGDHEVTVLKILERTCPAPLPDKFRLIHQLDYATSGVMMLGLNKRAAGEASGCFESRETQKRYLAVVIGHVPNDHYEFHEPIANDPHHDFKMMIGNESHPGKVAHTVMDVLQRGYYEGKPVSKVLLSPFSGRRHQLRVHLANAGYPILGDATYANDSDSPRMFLHAWKLTVPLKKRTLTFSTPDPFADVVSPIKE
eukprot:TRINITY_DN20017_c0_g1::TRINITY_DN20017_c0_g1_i1::g.1309::m.1309 TRINITY_DN20017_c0_g1::TRINITY_DN20017_c0_g1_i1::g.1309  ORF type:complete len:320 (-),score=22.89,sp/Q8VCZ8/RUSD1_MOUSE/39.91/7e-41,PseudoU_synth_2/PF00849.17/5.2e-27 TRINITY_DN20017_c0_g1_i1:452-1411(-)